MKTPRITNSDEKRLKAAGWTKKKKGWKSPYSGNVLTMEAAVQVELMMDPNL